MSTAFLHHRQQQQQRRQQQPITNNQQQQQQQKEQEEELPFSRTSDAANGTVEASRKFVTGWFRIRISTASEGNSWVN